MKNFFLIAIASVSLGSFIFTGCSSTDQSPIRGIIPSAYKDTVNGKPTHIYFIHNQAGMVAAFTDYGARLVGLLVPTASGQKIDVALGLPGVKAYEHADVFFGATIGPVTNRIAAGQFKLDGKTYVLPKNEGNNTLHSGMSGFQRIVWNAKSLNDSTLVFTCKVKDKEDGFPGNRIISETFQLNGTALNVAADATTDKPTIINLTNHFFFNLNGEGSGPILLHNMQIYADRFTPVDSTLIPTGKILPVASTPFDFQNSTVIGNRISLPDPQLKTAGGFDHNYVLLAGKTNDMHLAATVRGNISGIVLRLYTVEPGLQFYSGNHMKGKYLLKKGSKDIYRTAFVLDPQFFPNSPNIPAFPSTVLKPGNHYQTKSSYQFNW